MKSSDLSKWAEFLDELSDNSKVADWLEEGLADWKSSWRNRKTAVVANGILNRMREGESFGSAVANQPQIPASLSGFLARASERDCLAEVAIALSKHYRDTKAYLDRGLISIAYLSLVLTLAWIGVVFTIWHMVPALSEAFRMMVEESTWWLDAFVMIRNTMRYWGIAIPLLVLIFAFAMLRRERSKEMDSIECRRLLASGVAESLAERRDMVQAVDDSCKVFEIPSTELGMDLHSNSIDDDGLRQSIQARLVGLTHWLSQKSARQRRWRGEYLPSRIALIATIGIIAFYLVLVLFPWLWMIYKTLNGESR